MIQEAEMLAALQDILIDPPGDQSNEEHEIVDPHEGWERVPPTLDALLDWLRSLDRRYENVRFSTRRFWLVEWLEEISVSFGPFRCLEDLSSALFSIDRGNLHPLLKREHRPGRPRLNRIEFQNHCLAALAIDALKSAGWKIERSSRWIAEWLSKRGVNRVEVRSIRYSRARSTSAWETIKEWRDEAARIAQGKGLYPASIREIAVRYLRQRKRLPLVIEARGVDPKSMAEQLLEHMRPLPKMGKSRGALLPIRR